jgi:hypothetical protein
MIWVALAISATIFAGVVTIVFLMATGRLK